MTTVPAAPEPRPAPARGRWLDGLQAAGPVLLLLVAVAVVGHVRLRLASMPLERDEGEYAYLGQLLLGGVPPYQAAANMKWPGTSASYAVIMAVLGQSATAIRVGLIAVNLLGVLLVHRIARRCAGAAAGCLAATVYALLSLSPAVLGLAAHATHFVVVPGLLAVWLVQAPKGQRNADRLLLAGMAAAVATIMKQSGAAFLGFVVYWVALCAIREKAGLGTAAARLARVAVGFAFPIALMLGTIFVAGTFPRFWFWTWDYARAYAGIATAAEGARHLGTLAAGVLAAAPLLAVLAVAGLAAVAFGRRHAAQRAFVLGFAACSFLAVCPGLYFYEHYLIQFLPAAAVAAGLALAPGPGPAGAAARLRLPLWAATGAVALAAAQMLYAGREVFFRQTPAAAARAIYGLNPFPEAEVIGGYLATHCPPGARIAVIGSEPEIYFYARRRAATGFLYVYPFTENQPYARRMAGEFTAEIERGAPEYVVFVDDQSSWYSFSPVGANAGILQWFQRYEQDNLTLVGLIEMLPNGLSCRWRFDGPKVTLPPRLNLAIFRRVAPPTGPGGAGQAAGREGRVTIAW